jgi:protein-S-isoprenylcysteine O-methyltransferase Ste14
VSLSERGVGWVVAQSALLGVVAVVCFATPNSGSRALVIAGVVLMLAGAFVAAAAAAALGRSLTPFPRPKPTGELVTRGPFRFVRHPLYTGALLFLAGTSLVLSLWALIPTAALLMLWTLKARLEERHLVRAFPEYPEYARRVRGRFVPFVF